MICSNSFQVNSAGLCMTTVYTNVKEKQPVSASIVNALFITAFGLIQQRISGLLLTDRTVWGKPGRLKRDDYFRKAMCDLESSKAQSACVPWRIGLSCRSKSGKINIKQQAYSLPMRDLRVSDSLSGR